MRALWLVFIMIFLSRSFRGAFALTFFFSITAHTQNIAEQELRETVVTASRTEQILTDVIPHTTVLGRDAIENSQLIDLPSLLAREAGFQFTQNGARGTAATSFLRGAASLQVLVLLDGVPMTKQDTTGAVSLEHIMLDQVERIEIVRGNVSAIYGSGAIGGVIQVFTRQGDSKPSTFATSEFGSFGTQRLLVGTQGSAANWRYSFSLGNNSSDGISAMNPSQGRNINPDSNGYKNDNYAINLSYKIDANHQLGVRANGTDGRFTYDSSGDDVLPTDINQGSAKIDSQTVYWTARLNETWQSKLHFSEINEKNTINSSGSYPYNAITQTNTQLLSWLNELQWNQVVATLGVDAQKQGVTSSDDAGSPILNKQRHAMAVYAGGLYAADLNSFQLNIRHDQVEDTGSNNSIYLGYGRDLGGPWKLTLAHSTAFNVAPLGYIYDAYYGNQSLKPETATTNEVGLQWAENSHVMRSTYFSTSTRDLLLYDNATSKFGNISRVKNQGLETSYSRHHNNTDIRASLTLQKPINEETGAILVRRARALGSLSASRLFEKWTIGASLRYTGIRPDTGSNPGLDRVFLIDTTAKYKISKDWLFFGRIENVTDQKYQTAYGYNQLPRAVYMGVMWSMKH